MDEQIKIATEKLTPADILDLRTLTGFSTKAVDYWKKGQRIPDKFVLYFVMNERPGTALADWAQECLTIRGINLAAADPPTGGVKGQE